MPLPTKRLAMLIVATLYATAALSQPSTSLQLENTALRVTLEPTTGIISVLDKRIDYTWNQPGVLSGQTETPATLRFRNVHPVDTPHPGIAFEADFGETDGKPNTLLVTLSLPAEGADLIVDADMADRNAAIKTFPFIDSFVLDSEHAVLAVADYANGHLYPLDGRPIPKTHFDAARLDMPWVGVCDLERGLGYLLLVDTSDDAGVGMVPCEVSGRKLSAPRVEWQPSKNAFAYARRLIYRFIDTGGYVALAKAYRAHAQQQGLIVPFAEKLKVNPNIQRLFGAPNVWGNASLEFAREAKAAGVDKMLIQGRSKPEDVKAINELGYVTSEYDNYTDILPVEEGKEPDNCHDYLPDAAVMKADGSRMTAWLTWDKKTQYMKRSPALWMRAAQFHIPKVIAQYPFVGRFIDVTTAEGLYEDYDPNHPLTKGDKRRCGEELLAYVRSLGLVMGGEHGIWWCVPHLDFIEGMMSGGYYSWPAGHLLRPASKDQEFTWPNGGKLPSWDSYAQWGIGHEWRAPLWELVFHDCIVSTWYWGDSNDFLLEAAPEITAKKDAYNILYGTMPMMWATSEGAWRKNREMFLRTYRNTCKLHEVVAGTELLSHEFLTPDHAVQRTRFSDGTEVVVNFGATPYTARVKEKDYLLPENGFAAKGPRIEQSLVRVGETPVTTIQCEGYCFSDAGGVELTMRRVDGDTVRVDVGHVAAADESVFRKDGGMHLTVDPRMAVPDWETATTRAFVLDTQGERVRGLTIGGVGPLTLSDVGEERHVELVCRTAAAKPDFCVVGLSRANAETNINQGDTISVTAVVANRGGTAGDDVEVAVFADYACDERRLATQRVSLASGTETAVTFDVDTSRLDGERTLVVVADSANQSDELCERDNVAELALRVDAAPNRWANRGVLRVETGAVERVEWPVETELALPNVEPGSVRVCTCDETGALASPPAFLPTQFEAKNEDSGRLSFLLPGATPANTVKHVCVLWSSRSGDGTPTVFPQRGRIWDEPSNTVTASSYAARFVDGVLSNLAARGAGQTGEAFVSSLVFSSKETGWVKETGTVDEFSVLANGPVKTVVRVRRSMDSGVTYEKVYSFYPCFFDVEIALNKPAGGFYSRAYYLREGTYQDDQGFTARIDGHGDAEDVSGRAQNPAWYAVFAEDWAHACIALNPFGSVGYWDASSWGGAGLTGPSASPARLRYTIHAGAKDSSFAASDCVCATTPVLLQAEGGLLETRNPKP